MFSFNDMNRRGGGAGGGGMVNLKEKVTFGLLAGWAKLSECEKNKFRTLSLILIYL